MDVPAAPALTSQFYICRSRKIFQHLSVPPGLRLPFRADRGENRNSQLFEPFLNLKATRRCNIFKVDAAVRSLF
jgi:hypothetical protein